MKKDEFGDRMKTYEARETIDKLIPLLPVLIRLDGICFSSFTRGLKRPYDIRLTHLMEETTSFMVDKTSALIGYTQSDEISLLLYSDNFKSQIFFDGKKFKLLSACAAYATSFFIRRLPSFIPELADAIVAFDCRVWQVPNKEEAVNAFLWRELDATKNSVSMAAREYCSHNELHGLGRSDQMELLYQKGVNWNDYPISFKRGTYIQKRKVLRKFTFKEIQSLPFKHEARNNPDMEVERNEVRIINMPPLAKVINRVDVFFEGQSPITGA